MNSFLKPLAHLKAFPLQKRCESCIVLILSIHNPVVAVIEQILIYLALVLTVISLLDYLIKNWKVLDDGKM